MHTHTYMYESWHAYTHVCHRSLVCDQMHTWEYTSHYHQPNINTHNFVPCSIASAGAQRFVDGPGSWFGQTQMWIHKIVFITCLFRQFAHVQHREHVSSTEWEEVGLRTNLDCWRCAAFGSWLGTFSSLFGQWKSWYTRVFGWSSDGEDMAGHLIGFVFLCRKTKLAFSCLH